MGGKPTIYDLEKLLHEDDAEVFIDSDGSVSTTNYKEKYEYWESMARRSFVGGWTGCLRDKNRAGYSVSEIYEFYEEWLQQVMENFS